MDKKQKLMYDVVGVVLGIVLVGSLTAAVYGHLWLSEFSEIPGDELVTLFSEEAASEKENMEDMRLIGGFSSLIAISLTAVYGNRYYEIHEDAKWEMQKGLASGLISAVIGIFFYVFSPNLLTESIGLAMVIFGTIFVLGNAVYLVSAD